MSSTTLNETELIQILQRQVKSLQEQGDVRWLSLTGSNCFLMVLGFALVEAGSLRAKNLSMVMLKQIVVACISGVVWYLWGHGLAFGVDTSESTINNFVGSGKFALHDVVHTRNTPLANWFFQMTFCCVSCSIISGAIGERMKFIPYCGYVLLTSGWIYPVACYAQWSEYGWNSPFHDGAKVGHTGQNYYVGAVDAAGCGPVHIIGGIAAIVGAFQTGPRKGRFVGAEMTPVPMPGHNSALVTIGVLLLWFAWFSFNSGATIINQENHHIVIARAVCNTMIASTTSGISVLVFKAIPTNFTYFPLNGTLGGVLTGLVTITAGCTVIEPWAAFICGVLSAPVYLGLCHIELNYLKIDDPVDAFPIHFGGGLLGLFLTALFAQHDAMEIAYQSGIPKRYAGAFMGGDGILIGFNLLAAVFCIAWSAFFTFAYFYIINKTFGLRYSAADEESGMAKMFGDGYDYLTPIQQVQLLASQLTSLQATLMDGVTHPSSDTASDTTTLHPSRANSRTGAGGGVGVGAGAASQEEQQREREGEDDGEEDLEMVDFQTHEHNMKALAQSNDAVDEMPPKSQNTINEPTSMVTVTSKRS